MANTKKTGPKPPQRVVFFDKDTPREVVQAAADEAFRKAWKARQARDEKAKLKELAERMGPMPDYCI